MQSSRPRKLRASIPEGSCLSYVSPDESSIVLSSKPSKLVLLRKSEYDQDPFKLNSDLDASTGQAAPAGDYKVEKEVELGVGTLVLLEKVEFDTESAFIAVSNDKALVVLDKDLQELFRNEELVGSTDLCFFTCAGVKRDSFGNVQGRPSGAIGSRVRF